MFQEFEHIIELFGVAGLFDTGSIWSMFKQRQLDE